MTLIPTHRPHGCSKCDCGCMCHKMKNVRHILPCCGHASLGDDDGDEDARNSWLEHMSRTDDAP